MRDSSQARGNAFCIQYPQGSGLEGLKVAEEGSEVFFEIWELTPFLVLFKGSG